VDDAVQRRDESLRKEIGVGGWIDMGSEVGDWGVEWVDWPWVDDDETEEEFEIV